MMDVTQTPASPRVLIAEADPVERELLGQLVHELRADARVEQSFNGLGTLERLATFKPDLVIADWELPGAIDGLGLLRMVRQQGARPPLAFLLSSSRNDAASVRSVLPLAPTAYLTKPLQWDKLRLRLQELLNRPALAAPAKPLQSVGAYIESRRDDAPGAPVSVDLHVAFKRSLSTKVIDLSQLERDLRNEPQITGLLIATANAAAQHTGQPAQTLVQAMVGLGQAQCLETLFGLSLQPGLRLTDPSLFEAAQGFWIQSLRIATFARALARMEGLDTERCFAAGLLHAMGDLTVLRCLQDWLSLGGTLEEGDIARMVRAHAADFGSALRMRWRLPHEMRELIGASYEFGGGVYSREALVLNLAGELARLDENADLEELSRSKPARLLQVGAFELQKLRDGPDNPALAALMAPVLR